MSGYKYKNKCGTYAEIVLEIDRSGDEYMKKHWLLIGLLIMGIGSSICAAPLDEVSIVPVNYQNRIYVNKDYVNLSYEKYKVNNEANIIYLPLRLLSNLIGNDEEMWSVKWDKKKPDEVILECIYMIPIEGGRMSSGKSQVIKLSVGSKAFEKTFVDIDGTKTKESGELSQTPKKINGSINLPLRAIGELIGKKVDYKDGLVFISNQGIKLEGDEISKDIQMVKKNLEASTDDENPYTGIGYLVNLNGINYYEVEQYDEESGKCTMTIYSQKDKGASQVVKTIKNSEGCVKLVDYTFYYVVENSKGRALEKYDLTTMQSQVVWQIAEGQNWDFIRDIIPMEDTLYIVTHSGDWTMCSEALHKVVNGKSSEVITCHQFGAIEMSGDMIYYTAMNHTVEQHNIGAYNQKTKKDIAIGTTGYAYDLKVGVIDGEVTGFNIMDNVHIHDGKLYTLAYQNGSNEKQAVYSIDLKTNEQKKLTTPADDYWFNNNHIYYIEEATGFIKVVDLEGNGEKTLVNTPVQKAELKNNCLYYTKEGINHEIGEGLYIYGLTTGKTTTVSEKPIRDFKVSGKRIAYVVAGYAPGIYKWIEGKNTTLVEGIIRDVNIGEGSIAYKVSGQKESRVVKY